MANTGVSAPIRPAAREEAIPEQEWFDLQPIEKKLCGYSFGLGVALLVVFIVIFEVLH
ncbi:hypothetical protein [Acetonema longum]|uniref:Uncharacterized protein n=1 Tax=Acetonema longum DSM 6540 TaxID=1009370 RepID=F7NQ12_9FIRM|nr:hypothetical protein [Acetonema longum]EGO61889.1 hypothetical protein ALO_21057 [Acetonema longum DSM 6540]